MFPQGSVLGIETAFQQGACAVAEKLGVTVLPVVIAGSHRVWEHPFSPVIRRSMPVYMEVLAPRRIDDSAGFRTLEREMKRVALDNTWAPARRYVPPPRRLLGRLPIRYRSGLRRRLRGRGPASS
jgi:1-acyl-sn-glycerol-3-phosphate acyltransferase